MHPCAGPWSDTHPACARVARTRHQSTSGLGLEMGSESQACSSRMESLGEKFLTERGLGWEACPLNLPWPLLLFEVFLSCLPLPVCTGMPPRDTVSTAALPRRLEAILKQSITNSGQCCRQTPLPVPQPHISSLSPSLSTSCRHSARCHPIQLQPSPQGAREGSRAECMCRDLAWLGAARVYTDMPIPQPRHHPVPRGPQQRHPRHRVRAQAGGLALKTQPLPANTTQLPQLFGIVQASEPCQRCSPGCPPAATHRQRSGLPDQRAALKSSAPQAGTAALQPPAPGSLRPRGEPGWQHQPRGSERGLINYSTWGTRLYGASSPSPCTPTACSNFSTYSEINSFRAEICQAWLGSKGNSWRKFK